MQHINPSEVALVGIIYEPKWYSGRLKSIKHTDKIRGDLILYSLRYANGIGYRVIVVENDCPKTFLREIKKLKGVRVISSNIHKRSPNRRKAIFEASKLPGVKAIIMTEIEKVSFITDGLLDSVEPVIMDQADLVVPKRELGLFRKSYPSYMFDSEVEGNLLYNEALRANGLLSSYSDDLDLFFGARVFKNNRSFLKKIFSRYESTPFDSISAHKLFDLEEYSNSQFFPVVKALADGFRVKSVTVPFEYPQTQKMNEETGEREAFIYKRKYQKLTIIIELMHFLGYLERKKTRKIKKI